MACTTLIEAPDAIAKDAAVCRKSGGRRPSNPIAVAAALNAARRNTNT